MPHIPCDLQPAYYSLCRQGQQFPEPRESTMLPGITYDHAENGPLPVKIDKEALAMQGAIYTGDQALGAALLEQDIPTQPWGAALRLLDKHLQSDNNSLVWGFSGYATGGVSPTTGKPFSYHAEADMLCGVYDYLAEKDELPSLAIDGGVSEGFLALSSVVARRANIPTLGFLPLKGLSSAGTRDHLVVAGNTYPDRETLVATADVLVCAGGFRGTRRECQKAVSRGAGALLLASNTYPPTALPNIFDQYKDLQNAFDKGQLIVCNAPEEIPECIDDILALDTTSRRPLRQAIISDFLRDS